MHRILNSRPQNRRTTNDERRTTTDHRPPIARQGDKQAETAQRTPAHPLTRSSGHLVIVSPVHPLTRSPRHRVIVSSCVGRSYPALPPPLSVVSIRRSGTSQMTATSAYSAP